MNLGSLTLPLWAVIGFLALTALAVGLLHLNASVG